VKFLVDALVHVPDTLNAEKLLQHCICIASRMLIHCMCNAVALLFIERYPAGSPVVHDEKQVGTVLALVEMGCVG
jgi:hypothetical protein